MNPQTPAIEIDNLVRRYGRTDAVDGLSLRVEPGRCYGFFGRNGAGKTTTIKCLLNLLRPTSGTVKVFGLDPARDEVAVKSRIAYVPDQVAFYPWMTVRETLDYCGSFRAAGISRPSAPCSTSSVSTCVRRPAISRRASEPSWRSSPPSVRSLTCWSWMNRRPGSIPSFGASSSRR
jgi:ABC-2 type transport system ATP-binding protein